MPIARRPTVLSKSFFIANILLGFFFALSRAKKSQALLIEARPPKGGQIDDSNIAESDGNAVSRMQHLDAECIRWRRAEVNDLSESSATGWNFSGRFPAARPDRCMFIASRLAQMRVLMRLLGTKLEHGASQCYMWITGDRRARRIGERIGSI
jgi:hypothetical protein